MKSDYGCRIFLKAGVGFRSSGSIRLMLQKA